MSKILLEDLAYDFKSSLNFKRNNLDRLMHAKNLDTYLEQLEDETNKKTRGYVSMPILICYIFGFVLSIITVICLLVFKN